MGLIDRVKNIFRPAPKPSPSYDYSTPIGPTQPGKTISQPTPGKDYSTPIGPTQPTTRTGSGGSSSSRPSTPAGVNEAGQLVSQVPLTTQEIAKQTFTPKPSASTSATQVMMAGDSARFDSNKSNYSTMDKPVGERLGFSRGDAPAVRDTGVLILNPIEAMGMRSSTRQYTTTEGFNPLSSAEYGARLGGVQLYPKTPFFGYTKKAYIDNTQAIESSKKIFLAEQDLIRQFKANPESFRGMEGFDDSTGDYTINQKTFQSNIDYDSIFKGSKDIGKTRYLELDKSTSDKLIRSEVGVGFSKVVTGIPLAGINLVTTFGSGKIEEGKSISLFGDGSNKVRYSPNTFLGKIQDTPTGGIGKTVEYGSIVGAVAIGGGLNIVKAGSVKGGLLETASYGNVFKIRSGVYSPIVNKKDIIDIKSYKVGESARVYQGNVGDKGITFKGIEVKGIGSIETKTPYMQIRYGGLDFNQGNIFNTKTYTTSSSPIQKIGGVDVNNILKGSVGRTLVLTESQSVITNQGRLVSTSFDATSQKLFGSTTTITQATGRKGFTNFVSGQSKPIYSSQRTPTGFEYAPTGRYALGKAGINIRGTELDFTQFFSTKGSSSGGVGFKSFSGGGSGSSRSFVDGGSTILSQTTSKGFSSVQSTNIGGLIQTVKASPTSTFPTLITTTTPTVLSTTKARTSTVFVRPTTTQSVNTQSSSLIFPPIVSTNPISRSRSKDRQIIGNITSPILAPAQKYKIPQITKQVGSGLNNTIIGGSFTLSPFNSFRLAPPKLLGVDASGGLGKIKVRRTYRYTPSFGALALRGQKFRIGETTTKRFTGLEFRGTKRKKNKRGEFI